MEMAEKKIVISKSIEELKHKIGSFLLNIVKNALQERGHAIIGVSGGSMPAVVAPLLSSDTSVDWSLVRFFAVDERLVPLTDKDSNTGSYLRLLPEKFKNYFVEFGPIEDGTKCARNYAKRLLATNPPLINGWPQFDLLLLGHGPDGHTCSLFPGHSLLKNDSDLVAYIEDSPKPPPKRITLTMRAVNNALNVAFISTGENKAEIIKSILDDRDEKLPAALVQPVSRSLHWFLDLAAASKLRNN